MPTAATTATSLDSTAAAAGAAGAAGATGATGATGAPPLPDAKRQRPAAGEPGSVSTSRSGRVSAAVVLERPIDDAIVVGSTLVVLERDSVAVAGYSLVSATQVWRRPQPAQAPRPQALLHLGTSRVLVRGTDWLQVLESVDGAVVAEHATRLDDRRYLWERDGACGLRGSCSMQLVDCNTAAPIGPPIRGQVRERMSWDGAERHSGCWGFELELVGRTADTVVFLTEDATGLGSDNAFGMDARTGRLGWRSAAVRGSLRLERQLGMSPDGTTCWAWSEGTLTAFACAGGSLRWSQPSAEARMTIWAGGSNGGVFVASGTAATLYDPLTGKVRWSQPVAPDIVPLPTRGTLPPNADVAQAWTAPSGFVLLDPTSGAVVERRSMASPVARVSASGSISLTARGPSFDHTGQRIDTLEPPVLVVSRDRAAGTGTGPANEASLSTTWDDATFAVLHEDAWLLGERAEGDAVVATLLVASEPRQARIYRLTRVSERGR